MSKGNVTERDLDREYRAYQLLRWSTPAPLAEFNEELAAEGFYSRIQKERSDKALDAFEAALPAPPLSELDAFRELEALGVLTQADYYSPAAAKEHEYSRLLTSHRKQPETPHQRRPNDADQQQQHNSISDDKGRVQDTKGQSLDQTRRPNRRHMRWHRRPR